MELRKLLELYGDDVKAEHALTDGRVSRIEGVNGATHKRERIPADVLTDGGFRYSFATSEAFTSGNSIPGVSSVAPFKWYGVRVTLSTRGAREAAERWTADYWTRASGRILQDDFVRECRNETGVSQRVAVELYGDRPKRFKQRGRPKHT